MWSDRIIVFAPFLDDYLSFVEGVEYLPVDLMAVWFSALDKTDGAFDHLDQAEFVDVEGHLYLHLLVALETTVG